MDDFVKIAVPSILTAGFAFVAAYFFHGIRKRDDDTRANLASQAASESSINQRIRELELQLAAIEPITTAFRLSIVKKLTHLHTPELDGLLARIGDLNEAEIKNMESLLLERAYAENLSVDEDERDAAIILPYVIRMEQKELASPVINTDVKLVTVQKSEGEQAPKTKPEDK